MDARILAVRLILAAPAAKFEHLRTVREAYSFQRSTGFEFRREMWRWLHCV